jgi:molecular chaperone GrpE
MTENPPEPEANPQEPAQDSQEQLRKELAECKDKYLRQLAESENMRKRLQKEKQESIQYALSNLLAEFLGPIDHMENALKHTQHMSDEVKHWGLGFQMILTQFKDVLAQNGVTPIEAKGRSFDPLVHDALETVEADGVQDGTIVEECSRGYKMGERVIRPSRVKVAKKISKNEKE